MGRVLNRMPAVHPGEVLREEYLAPLLFGETRWRESAHFGEGLGNAIGLGLGQRCDRPAGKPFLRNRPHLANQEIGVLVKFRPREDACPKWHVGARPLQL